MHRLLPVSLLVLVTIQQACRQDEPGALTGPKPRLSPSADNTLRFTAITAGRDHTCALTPGGDAYCWGGNGGALGDGTTSTRLVPTPVAGGLRFTDIGAGDGRTCALTPSGEAYCWGRGFAEDGTRIVWLVPTPVPGELRFKTLSKFGNCGVTPGGEAYCGIGVSSSPTPVPGELHFEEVGTSCGLTPGGEAYCWGDNFYGELGIGNFTGPERCGSAPCSTVPVAVAGGLRFAALSVGTLHNCGVTPDGAAYCWGRTWRDFGPGEFEPGVRVFAASPRLIGGELRFSAVDAGWFLHACGVTHDGAAYCWGSESPVGGDPSSPALVSDSLHFTAVTAGYRHDCGLTPGGVAYCWGGNGSGQLGNGTTSGGGPTPQPVAAPVDQ